ncbi:uncharacterized protein LOC110919958 [Helianthus annuus]|uniref:uncharacterized protein LOC110919958 n=1 Tax=Helianthus annuus TaxID=4232 RepID=UPI000B90A286|nr:uncharacterized protein LOC110919958 [Helianthus annuus]
MAIQESKLAAVDDVVLAKIWGGRGFSSASVDSSGLSGGLICIWDPSVFSYVDCSKNRNFLLVNGFLKGCGSPICIINVYTPQGISAKKDLWDLLEGIVSGYSGLLVLIGDFNAVRFPEERLNSMFKPRCAGNFNSFIFNSSLLEYKMQEKQFTRWAANGRKMSKIDRALVSAEFFSKWPSTCLRALCNLFSDHCPLLLSTKSSNFGPIPFRCFNSWLGRPGYDEVVSGAASGFVGDGPPDVYLSNKLRFIKSRILNWRDELKAKEEGEVAIAKSDLEGLQRTLEERELEEEEEWAMAEAKKIILISEENFSKDIRQRSRDRWIKDGDENSKYFHSVVNYRKARNGIFGLVIDGVWCDKPTRVKKYVFEFFRDKFKEPHIVRPS